MIYALVNNPSEGNKFKPNKIITTYRPFSECIASKIRMGWLKNTPEAKIKAEEQQRQLYKYWQSKSDYEVQYCRLISEPTIEISGIANILGVNLPKITILKIAKELLNLSAPKDGPYDPVTLLHPNHRTF